MEETAGNFGQFWGSLTTPSSWQIKLMPQGRPSYQKVAGPKAGVVLKASASVPGEHKA